MILSEMFFVFKLYLFFFFFCLMGTIKPDRPVRFVCCSVYIYIYIYTYVKTSIIIYNNIIYFIIIYNTSAYRWKKIRMRKKITRNSVHSRKIEYNNTPRTTMRFLCPSACAFNGRLLNYLRRV